jgi:hypothetical protein
MTAHNTREEGRDVLERILSRVELIEEYVEHIAAQIEECLNAARYGAEWRSGGYEPDGY